MDLTQYLEQYGSRITQNSERLFLTEFLYPILGENIGRVIPQYPFLDSSGKNRRIDFAMEHGKLRLALEVNGETYHAEGIIPNPQFDDNLFRQNEIIRNGWHLLRFSYHQLQDKQSRRRVYGTIVDTLIKYAPELIGPSAITPTPLQKQALERLKFFREEMGWQKGIVILPTGTGKTYLSALDAKSYSGRVLFVVHRLDILKQSMTAFQHVWPGVEMGTLTGEVRDQVDTARVLFASKDTLRQEEVLSTFAHDAFDYVIVDEVHHGQTPTYRTILEYLKPRFMLGMTATPDRQDRKDIFELFDYNLIFEFSLFDAIEQGYLVPFTYYGLHDDIDYRRIRYDGKRYNVQDLEKALLIPKRNEALFREYLEKGEGDKAIGFCVSISHAEGMAEFFNQQGISAVAITSNSPNREQLIEQFRENQYQVAFTVDLFNEGVDFPNVRVLMFLRPTESKTVFLQQLGRGLRLCTGKDRVRILDFIGNYRKANCVRKYLAHPATIQTQENQRSAKPTYEYAPGCEVNFTAEVEEILNRQDQEEQGVTKDDLIQAYYAVAEKLQRKPTQTDLNHEGTYKVSRYQGLFGSWLNFLREIGEYTEASYHYPQGVHLGHILYILQVLASGQRNGTLLDEHYVRLRGNLDKGRIGNLQRQTKYKLQAMMELGVIPNDRELGLNENYSFQLTAKGKRLYDVLKPVFKIVDLSFYDKTAQDDDYEKTWDMVTQAEKFNHAIWQFLQNDSVAKETVRQIFLAMPAVAQMLNYLYRVERQATVAKANIYGRFFTSPEVKEYCDQHGIEVATEEGAKHRCPFLLNILEAIGLVEQNRKTVTLKTFLIAPATLRMNHRESDKEVSERVQHVITVWSNHSETIPSEELSKLREAFGSAFLTPAYFLSTIETMN